MKTENKNFLLNIIYQLLTFVIPFITVPYISRILGVDHVGIYSYTYSIVYLFMLVGMLGVNNYGNRSIAAVRDDKRMMSKTFISIYVIQLCVSIFALLVYFLYLVFVCKEYKYIASIQTVFLVSVCFDINWFYFGIEKFKITIFRNVIIKFFSLVLIFTMVRTTEDLPVYTIIMAGATLLSQVVLVIILPGYVEFMHVGIRDVIVHVRGIITLFIPVIAFGVYHVMDKAMLGAMASVTELGYYENAEKLINIPLAVIAALGTVMLPRMSYILSKNISKYQTTILQSMTLAMKLAAVMCAGLVLIADEAAIVLFGAEFVESSQIVQLLSVTLIASAWANVVRTQYLIPLNKDKIYVYSTLGAALLNFLFNMIFIPKYGGVGACIGTIMAEFFIVVYQTVATWKELEYEVYFINLLIDLIKSVFIIMLAYILAAFAQDIVIKLLIKIMVTVLLFIFMNARYLKYDFFGITPR